MEDRVAAIREGGASELVWLLEHPPLYTAGTSANPADLVEACFPVFASGRGGQYTYHGPGQRVAYVMLDLAQRGPDLKRYIRTLEEWLIVALTSLDIAAERRPGRVGLWIDMARHGGAGEAKIAAIGVRVRRWVTFHGVSVNVDPDLSHFSGIVPCGIREHGVTSLAALGCTASMAEVDQALKAAWERTDFVQSAAAE
jgi:lipoyl(octanoyl) transferase